MRTESVRSCRIVVGVFRHSREPMYQRENRIPYRHFQQYFGEIPPDGGAIAAKQISRFVRTARCFPPRSQPGLTPLFHTFVRRHIRRLKAYSSSTLTRRELSGYQVPGKRSITAQPPPVPFNPFLSFLVTSLCPAFIDPYLQPQSATSSLLHHPRR